MHFQGYTEDNWDPVEMLNLKGFKEALVSYGMFSPFLKQFQIHGQLRTELFHQTRKIMLQKYYNLVLSYNGKHGEETKRARVKVQWSGTRNIEINQ